jgi:hypothetical protein
MRKNLGKYVRPGALPANTDIKTYDSGNFFLSTYGCQGTGNLGELRVKYTVRLSEPVLEPSQVVGGVVHFAVTNGTTADNFATGVLQPGGTPSLTGITIGSNSIVFPASIPGTYLINFTIAGATSASAGGFNSFGNGTAKNYFTQSGTKDATSSVASLAGTTTSVALSCATVSIPTGGATVVLAGSTIVGAGSGDLWIVSLPSTVLTVMDPAIAAVDRRLAALETMLSRSSVFEIESDDDFKTPDKPAGDILGELIRRRALTVKIPPNPR